MFITHYNVVVCRYKCLLMYLLTAITPPVDTCKWRLLYNQIMNDNILKYSCNNIKKASIGEVIIVDKYCTLIST